VTQLVIPAPDAFGGRVNTQTPLARVVAVLRQHNPRAPFAQLRTAAEALRLGQAPAVPFVQAESVPGSVAPSETAARVFVDESTKTRVDAEAIAAVPAASDNPPAVPERRKPTRAEVEAWVAAQPKRDRSKLAMSSRGRIPAATLAAYRAAHRDEVLASMVPVEGGAPIPAEPPEPEFY
jgi:hypothetical protein